MGAVEHATPVRHWKGTFTADEAEVPLARHAARAQLAGWGWDPDSDRVYDVLLILTELMTNVLRHASQPGAPVVVRLDETGGDCRVGVLDARPDLPLPQTPVACGERGRGLLLVRHRADATGVTTTATTKKVWASVRLTDDALKDTL
ncbi:ATP-binding protein [Kitasatospora sp. NPDC098663]|uniref:ATP-binding protein n=1 Tax=Kitasatospora sp. NPDC098663 TaxID=3364096 RepID=UPI0038257C58